MKTVRQVDPVKVVLFAIIALMGIGIYYDHHPWNRPDPSDYSVRDQH